ncbi:MAG: ATP synthase F0 subunit B [Bacteroidetes bacterium]|jgi:F-type H+-transporting ATPase subunit b|nr:ATP synthase F0 subunit B [Bacteroidota bacterium]
MLYLLASGGLLSFNTGFAIWIAISLVVFLLIMMKFAMPPIMQALEGRETKIRESLEAAEVALAKAEAISKDNEKALREAESKAHQIRKEAMDDAERIRNERVAKAKDEAEQIIEQAKADIEQEKQSALVTLRKEVANLAIQSATMILDAELDVEKNQKLVDNYINDLTKN